MQISPKPGMGVLGFLAGNALAVIYAFIIDDPEMFGERYGEDAAIDEAKSLVERILPGEQRDMGRGLEKAFREALCEAIYDIDGKACFRQLPQQRWMGVPIEASFPLSGGRNLWHVRDPRIAEICRILYGWRQAVKGNTPIASKDSQGLGDVWSAGAMLYELGKLFYDANILPYGAAQGRSGYEIPLFEEHVMRWGFERTWVRLGERISEPAYIALWVKFVDLLLEGGADLYLANDVADSLFTLFEKSPDDFARILARLVAESGKLRKSKAERIDDIFWRTVQDPRWLEDLNALLCS